MISLVQNIRNFWEEKKKSRLGQLYLLWIVSVVFGASIGIRASEFLLRKRLLFGIAGTFVIFVGLVLIYLLPAMYLAYIRKRKEAGRNVVWHRVLFGAYCFPVIPWLFMGLIALIMNVGMNLGLISR